MREERLEALEQFHQLNLPDHWAPNELRELDFHKLRYFLERKSVPTGDWKEVDASVRQTFERLGVVKLSQTSLGGVNAQYDSTIIYSKLQEQLEREGIVFVDAVTGLRDYPELFRPWFGALVGPFEDKFSALNAAVFSGGTFVYIPPGVKVQQPLKSYFRMNEAACGQFGRTLIIVDEGAELTFLEGCSAANHDALSLHASVGEIVAKRGAKIQYVTFQNWPRQVLNLVHMRAHAYEDAEVKWLDCNIGGRLTMKYPSTLLDGRNARTEIMSIGFAGEGQRQDTGGKVHHNAEATTSSITSKSISVGNGRASYRGLVDFSPQTHGCKNNTECDALLIHANSRTDTYPAITVKGHGNNSQHEASVSKIGEEQVFYMRQRGLNESEAVSLSVNGFINDLVRAFPVQYSATLRRLVDMEMEGSVG